MNYEYIYDQIALREYIDAIRWYKSKSDKAAVNFVKEVTDRIKIICDNPLRFRNLYKNFRETSLKKYPYSIVYFLDERKKKVVITSMFHNKRDPQKKYHK